MANKFTDRAPLATPVQYVKGVGPALAGKLLKMGILTVGDLLAVTPIRYLDRRHVLKISELTPGKDRTIVGNIVRSNIAFAGGAKEFTSCLTGGRHRQGLRKIFSFQTDYFEERYKVGSRILLSGEASAFSQRLAIHPCIRNGILGEGDAASIGRIIPVYPSTETLNKDHAHNQKKPGTPFTNI